MDPLPATTRASSLVRAQKGGNRLSTCCTKADWPWLWLVHNKSSILPLSLARSRDNRSDMRNRLLALFVLFLHGVKPEPGGASPDTPCMPQPSASREERLAEEMRRDEDCSIAARFGRTMYRDSSGQLREHRTLAVPGGDYPVRH